MFWLFVYLNAAASVITGIKYSYPLGALLGSNRNQGALYCTHKINKIPRRGVLVVKYIKVPAFQGYHPFGRFASEVLIIK